ncbi:MAG: type II secretion system protein [Patescibacteria group bacterium]
MKKSRLGFTLIELLIVIVIMGILSVAFLPTVLSGPKKARDARRISDVNSIAQAVQSFNLESSTGAYPTTLSDLGKYFTNNQTPKDPGTSADYIFFVNATNKCLIVGAKLESAEKANSDALASATTDCTAAPAVTTSANKIYYYQYIRQ